MTTLFFQSLLIAFAVQLIWFTMTTGEIFESIGDFFDDMIDNDKLKKPIFDCPICMTPYYGSALYFAIFYSLDKIFVWQHFAIVIMCAAGVNILVTKINTFHTRFVKSLDEAEEREDDDDEDDQYPINDFPVTPKTFSNTFTRNQKREHEY